MVADERADQPPGLCRLILQAHDQFDGINPTGASINKIAHKPQMCRAACPAQAVIDQPRAFQQRDQFVVLTVYITDDVNRVHVASAIKASTFGKGTTCRALTRGVTRGYFA